MPIDLSYDPSQTALFHPERRETLFARGVSYSNRQLALEASRLAYYRVEGSEGQQARLAEALDRVGFTYLGLFSGPKRGAAAFAALGADGMPLISFRGTQPDNVEAIWTDLKAVPVGRPEFAGKVHEGFADAVLSMKPQIADWIKRAKPDLSKLILTGHSLGAAMATLAATFWKPQRLITFGSPRVGDAAFGASVVATEILRFVDCCDLVTEEPPEDWAYRHVGKPTYVTRDAQVLVDLNSSNVEADRETASSDYKRDYAWNVLENVPARGLADHAMINYARAVFKD